MRSILLQLAPEAGPEGAEHEAPSPYPVMAVDILEAAESRQTLKP